MLMCSQDDVKYVLDGTRMVNVGRYINQSCNVCSPMPSVHLLKKVHTSHKLTLLAK